MSMSAIGKKTCPIRVLPNRHYIPCSFGMACHATILATYRAGPYLGEWVWLRTRKQIFVVKRSANGTETDA